MFSLMASLVAILQNQPSEHLLVQSQQRDTRKTCKFCSKLTIMIPEQRH